MSWYVTWVTESPRFAAFVQFALLGSLGELLGILAARGKPSRKALEWLLKALAWGMLGILVKYAFTGFKGFLQVLVDKAFLPAACEEIPLLRALSLSLLANTMFGPLLMVLHRASDNLITRARGFAGIERSLATLAWFWVPAHTVTFALPAGFQIGLAAAWSVVLGLIMGFTRRRG